MGGAVGKRGRKFDPTKGLAGAVVALLREKGGKSEVDCAGLGVKLGHHRNVVSTVARILAERGIVYRQSLGPGKHPILTLNEEVLARYVGGVVPQTTQSLSVEVQNDIKLFDEHYSRLRTCSVVSLPEALSDALSDIDRLQKTIERWRSNIEKLSEASEVFGALGIQVKSTPVPNAQTKAVTQAESRVDEEQSDDVPVVDPANLMGEWRRASDQHIAAAHRAGVACKI